VKVQSEVVVDHLHLMAQLFKSVITYKILAKRIKKLGIKEMSTNPNAATINPMNNYASGFSGSSSKIQPPKYDIAQLYKSAMIIGAPGRTTGMVDYQGMAGNNVVDLGFGTGPTRTMNQMLLRNYLQYSNTKVIPDGLYQDYRPLELITPLDMDPYVTNLRSYTQVTNPNPLIRKCNYDKDE
jgi:hypothetical protein